MVMTDVTTTLPPLSNQQLLVAAVSQTGTPYHPPWLPRSGYIGTVPRIGAWVRLLL
jgi:hypothetical protein